MRRRISMLAVLSLALACGGGDHGDLAAFCDVARDQHQALESGEPVDELAAAHALAEAAPETLQAAADAYVAALEAEAQAPSGDGEVDAAAVAETMEVVAAGSGPATESLTEAPTPNVTCDCRFFGRQGRSDHGSKYVRHVETLTNVGETLTLIPISSDGSRIRIGGGEIESNPRRPPD